MLLNGVLALSPCKFYSFLEEKRFQLNYNLIFTIMFIYQEGSSGEMQKPKKTLFGVEQKNPLKA
jgi:hypothetical protein